MTDHDKIQWCIDQHKKANHFYDKYLPYEFHLRMVVQVCEEFAHLHPNQWSNLKIACWGHDLIEDARVSYNDCKTALGDYAAEIIYAVTNEKGKTRKDRAGKKYYEGILETPGAAFVKLCDRIANVRYSQLTKSRMFQVYKDEAYDFETYLRYGHAYELMFEYLRQLFGFETVMAK